MRKLTLFVFPFLADHEKSSAHGVSKFPLLSRSSERLFLVLFGSDHSSDDVSQPIFPIFLHDRTERDSAI